MRTTKISGLLSLLLAGTCCGAATGQDGVSNWLPANEEKVRLDPANYHTARTYHPGSPGATNHVDIKAQQPVTVFMAPEGDWNAVLQNRLNFGQLRRYCVQEHVMNLTYVCEMPLEPMTLVILDDRNDGRGVSDNSDHAFFAGVGAVLNQGKAPERTIGAGIPAVLAAKAAVPPPPRHFVAPNDVHIQYYRWVQPETEWIRQVKEKYELSPFLKVYGGALAGLGGAKAGNSNKGPRPSSGAAAALSRADSVELGAASDQTGRAT